MAKVLIMHGWTNLRVEGNWHRYLATELRKLGHVVIYPQFPGTNNPLLEDWQDLLVAELEQLEEAGPGETIAIGHSLGCINWVHAAAAGKQGAYRPVLRVRHGDPAAVGGSRGGVPRHAEEHQQSLRPPIAVQWRIRGPEGRHPCRAEAAGD